MPVLTKPTNDTFFIFYNVFVTFKANIKKWTPKNCPCKLCKNYLHGVGYV